VIPAAGIRAYAVSRRARRKGAAKVARNKYDIDETIESPFNPKHFARSLRYVKNNAHLLVAALGLSLAASLLGLLGPYFTKQIIDESIPSKDLLMIGLFAGVYFLSSLGGEILGWIRLRISTRAGQQIIHEIREDLFAHLQRLPFTYYDSRPHGKILVRVVHYVNNVADFLSNGLIGIVIDVFSVIVILVFMLMLDTRLTLIVLGGLPFLAALVVAIKKPQRVAWHRYSSKNSNLVAYINESLNGIRITQAFTREDVNAGIFDRLCRAAKDAWLSAVRIVFIMGPSVEILLTGVSCALYAAGSLWLADSVTPGTVLAMAAYAGRFWGPINNLGNIYNSLINTGSYLERIFDTLDEPVEIQNAPDAYALPPISGEVCFDRVTFAYEPGIPVLENLSFTVRAGESVALVGPTGAGKTTVVNLLSRFYDVQGGRILVDGHPIDKVTLHSLRSQMGIMLQDTFIFSGSIRDNILYGRLDAQDDEVIEAAKAVRAHDFISAMPNGYDTFVNERGSSLSSGQRQLVSFARTILSQPKILVLDEATSSIDTETEMLLQEGIRALLKGRTSFIIAHRLSTIKSCDRIFYISDRGIAESGSHGELMARKGLYYKLYTSQFEH